MSALVAGVAGLVCGVFSGLGIGGGTLLMVWMTAVVSLEQQTAQGINLLYFLPTAACALFFHILQDYHIMSQYLKYDNRVDTVGYYRVDLNIGYLH